MIYYAKMCDMRERKYTIIASNPFLSAQWITAIKAEADATCKRWGGTGWRVGDLNKTHVKFTDVSLSNQAAALMCIGM